MAGVVEVRKVMNTGNGGGGMRGIVEVRAVN